MTASEREALERKRDHWRAVFGARYAAQNALGWGALGASAATLSTQLAPYLHLGLLTTCGVIVAAGLGASALSLLHHRLVVVPREGARTADLEHDLERGEVEVLRFPPADALLLIAHRGGDHLGYTVLLGFEGLPGVEGHTLALFELDPDEAEPDEWGVLAGHPPVLRGRALELVRAPASKADLPPRCSGEPLAAAAIVEDEELGETTWAPDAPEILRGDPGAILEALEGPAPLERRRPWIDF